MAVSIDNLKAKASSKQGFARPNVYEVILPTFGLAGFSGDNISLLCSEVTIPGRQIMTRERLIGMTQQKVAYGYAALDVQMTFRVMNDYGVRKYFEYWQNLAIDQQTKEVGFKKEYAKPVKIRQLKNGINIPIYSTKTIFDLDLTISATSPSEVVYEVTLLDAFPDTITGLSLGDNNDNSILEMQVSLAYTNWETTR